MENIEAVVLDFDGTLTDSDKEAETFIKLFKSYLASSDYFSNFGQEKFESLWNEEETKVQKEPDKYGWRYNDEIVAPPTCPYIVYLTITNLLMDKFNILPNKDERSTFINSLFQRTHKKTPTLFRENIEDFLYELLNIVPVFIVTASPEENIREKIKHLDDKALIERISIRGGVRKYTFETEVSDGLPDIPNEIYIEGLGRPVLPKRVDYYNVLKELIDKNNIGGFESLLVVGDVYELDLALPHVMNSYICLIENKRTLEYEKKAVKEHDKGYITRDLNEVIHIINANR